MEWISSKKVAYFFWCFHSSLVFDGLPALFAYILSFLVFFNHTITRCFYDHDYLLYFLFHAVFRLTVSMPSSPTDPISEIKFNQFQRLYSTSNDRLLRPVQCRCVCVCMCVCGEGWVLEITFSHRSMQCRDEKEQIR